MSRKSTYQVNVIFLLQDDIDCSQDYATGT